MRLTLTKLAQKKIHAAYPRYFSLLSLRKPIKVLTAKLNEFAAWAEKNPKLLLGFSRSHIPFWSMKSSLHGRTLPTVSFMKLLNWSHIPKARATEAVTISAFFHPSLIKRNTTTITYMGIHTWMLENTFIITSVNSVCILFMHRVISWSNRCISCQKLFIGD